MDKKKTTTLAIGVIAGIGGVLALLAAAGLILVYTGSYNVAATEQHSALVRWALDTIFHNSVERRSQDIQVPSSFTPAMIEDGARQYKTMCEHCHAGPGTERADWANGMRPIPPHLVEAASEWRPSEVFWLVEHGVKMSGMPAFGASQDEAALWSIVAFVKELPAMTPDRYAALPARDPSAPATVPPAH